VFKSVAKKKFRIDRLCQGIAEFVPVTYEEQYFSFLKCQINSVLLDYRFRVRSLKEI